MSEPDKPAPSPTENRDEGGGRGPLIALVLLVLLAAGGYLLAQHLRAANRVQDCVMAGRNNCAPVP